MTSTGIDFPTPVSQIDKLEKQNPNLAIGGFGWGKDHAIEHKKSEQDGTICRSEIQQGTGASFKF